MIRPPPRYTRTYAHFPYTTLFRSRHDLRSVDDQFVALDPPARLDAGKVRPRAGFRKALAPDRLAVQDTRQVIGFLRLARIKDQRRAAMVDADEVGADPRRMRLRILLQPDDLLDDRQPAPPIVGRPVDARPAGVEQPPLPRLVEIDRVGRVQRALLRGDMGVQPVAARFAKARLFKGKADVHQRSLRVLAMASLALPLSIVRLPPCSRSEARRV